jgi:hypothetical protein
MTACHLRNGAWLVAFPRKLADLGDFIVRQPDTLLAAFGDGFRIADELREVFAGW